MAFRRQFIRPGKQLFDIRRILIEDFVCVFFHYRQNVPDIEIWPQTVCFGSFYDTVEGGTGFSSIDRISITAKNKGLDLEEHFAKEERLVFPLIRGNEKPDEATIALVKSLEDEHTHAGDLIKKIQKETDNFTLPSDACNTYAYTFRNMKALFEDIFIHIFKENSVLFPEYCEKADPTLTKDPSDKFFLKDGSHATAFDTEEDYLDAQEDHAEELFHDHLVK